LQFLTLPQFEVSHSLAQSAFQVTKPPEKSASQPEIKWEDEVVQAKKWGQKLKDPKHASAVKSDFMRADAPDFEWPQPWEQLWEQQSIPSPASAHHLIERTNKLWQSEMVRSFACIC